VPSSPASRAVQLSLSLVKEPPLLLGEVHGHILKGHMALVFLVTSPNSRLSRSRTPSHFIRINSWAGYFSLAVTIVTCGFNRAGGAR